jgi:hypothetical protein
VDALVLALDFSFVLAHLALGELQPALGWLERAYEDGTGISEC